MDRERRESLKSLFEQASYLPANARAAFLDETCTNDPELRAELSSLLKAAESADPLFKKLAEAVPPLVDRFTVSALSDAAVLVGRMVRQYRVERMLGAGGMGVVYRAHDTLLERTVALKFLPHQVVADEEAAERFVVEARAAAALDHPNVCAVHEIERDEDHGPFIVMAFCDGETLKRKLTRGPVSVEEGVEYGVQIAAGLNAAHTGGIVHRDIKPGNLIVTSDGVVKILDFGLAKLVDVTYTGTGMTPGTAAYMSPEQTRGEELDARTDFWSLGVVLYEMLTGHRPFRGDRQGAVIHAIRHEEPEPPRKLRDEVPPEVEALVLGLLSKEPDGRYGSAQALLGDLAPLAPRGAELKLAAERRWTWGGERLIRRVVGVLALAAIGGWAVVALGGLRDDVPLDPDRVAVAVLTNLTGEAELDALGRQAAERITRAVQRREVADVAPTVGDARGGRRGMDAVSALARASGAGVVLHGAYYVLGDSLHFQIQITDVAEGEVMSAMAPVSAPRNARAEALSLLEQRTLGTLAAALDFRDGGEAFPPHHPPSLQAYRIYKQGQAAMVRGETEEALGYFEQARAVDSTWMPPLLLTAIALLGRGRLAEADSMTRLAARHLDHMSEPERLLLQMLRSYPDPEAEAVYLRSARRLAELVPYFVGFAYSAAWHTYRPQEGLEWVGRIDTTALFDREREATERPLYAALMHHALGNHETELEVAREGHRRVPEQMTLLHRYLSALAALGRTSEILALLDTVLAMPESRYRQRTFTPQGRVLGVGRELREHGYSAAARSVLQRGLDWIEMHPWEYTNSTTIGSSRRWRPGSRIPRGASLDTPTPGR
jgi:tetratricopeptide (TPR) repeat protein